MGVLDFFRRSKRAEFDLEKELASGKSALDIVRSASLGMRDGAVSKDVLPKGYGPYGLCHTNPIPADSLSGARYYLGRLRTTDGEKVDVKRDGCTAAEDVTNGLIDIYTLSLNGEIVCKVYICPYHKKTSNKAPAGFMLV